jgi:hypothetical protein
MAAYTYDPTKIRDEGKDQMRFELGDTMVEGGVATCALCDEEYTALIPDRILSKRHWKKIKLSCLESIMRRFAYESDQKVGPAEFKLHDRAVLWKNMYDELAADLSKTAVSSDALLSMAFNPQTGSITPPYFYNGMMSHEEAEGKDI